ncbi:glycerate kinase type-2 family protein [Afifella pfennigii]|uniref:glycerate kinase type-2 family protein n=1 Tax=Afifella pfennigii TaxID=209897 RepID=UPI00047BC955|nr:glycerate kinase [Afifella pfennigii]
MKDPKTFLRGLFDAAVAAADPRLSLSPHLPAPPAGRTIVVGAGKASAAMAKALESVWPGEIGGLVVTRYGHSVPCQRIEIVEAAHPVPDAAGENAARRMFELVSGLREDDLVIALISGGGSALLTLPPPGLTLADKQALSRALLSCGAPISEMNCVRKHLSAIKGGRLAAAAFPARTVTLAISDVPGDDPAEIASGPTVGDTTSAAEALQILKRYQIDIPDAAHGWLASAEAETPKPGDRRLARAEFRLIATPARALAAAAATARMEGVFPIILGDALQGEARELARSHAGLVLHKLRGHTLQTPFVLLSGGETTVTMSGDGKGRGGRNTEYLLALVLALRGEKNVYAIACDTDGIDGSQDNAGALAGPDTLSRAAALGLNAQAALAGNDSYSFFAALDDLVVTGPTLTNVNDFRAILAL